VDEPCKGAVEGEIIMKDSQFEAKLVAAKPVNYASNAEFTDTVMDSIQSSEILSSWVRKMSVNKKETFIMKFKHLPRIAIIAIALGALVVVSTGAYAAYQLLWQKPEASVSKPTTSQSGRKEVSLLFSQCGTQYSPERYELKRDATITADQIENVVKAQCELQTINEWAETTYGGKLSDGSYSLDSKSQAMRHPGVSLATHIKSISESSITFSGQSKYNTQDTTLDVPKNMRYIANGTDVTSTQFKPGDTVVYVTSQGTRQTPKEDCTTDACREFGEYFTTHALIAVIKLNRPFDDYDQSAWQSLTELSVCQGNKEDLCLGGYSGSIDLYMNTKSQDFKEKIISKEIQGVITELNGKNFKIKSSSRSIYTVTTPSDIVSYFNNNKSADYNNQKIKIGSTLSVRYNEKETEHTKTIDVDKVFWVTVKLEIVKKGDPVKLY